MQLSAVGSLMGPAKGGVCSVLLGTFQVESSSLEGAALTPCAEWRGLISGCTAEGDIESTRRGLWEKKGSEASQRSELKEEAHKAAERASQTPRCHC